MDGPDYWQAHEKQLEQQHDRAARIAASHRRGQDMPKIQDMIESKYLKQSDVDGEIAVTVQGVKRVNVARDDEDPEYRWTVKFAEFAKPMVLNVTNLKRLAKALGDDTDGWIGNQVVLYVDPDIEYGGNVVGGLRIRQMRASAPVAKARAALSDDAINRKLADSAPDNDIPFS